MTTALVSIGSNLGDREANVLQGVRRLHATPGIQVTAVSALYETEPVAMAAATQWFINAVIQLETSLSALELLSACLSVESALGRHRQPDQRNQSRVLDLDVLFYGQQILNTDELTVPHPRLHERAFVLVPLLELASDWIHPLLGQSVEQLYFNLPAPEEVRIAGMLDDWQSGLPAASH